MINIKKNPFPWRSCRAALISAALFFSISQGKTDVPVFLFSGQSNMVCLGSSVSDLSADQKKTVDNIKIDCRADNSTKTWATLGPGFAADANHFGPELFFGRTLSDSLPGLKIAFIKDAVSGTYLAQTAGWLPPSSTGGPGTLYKNMMTHIDKALATFKTAYDTAEYTPRWAGFVWLQGEFDGMDQNDAKAYETNLTNLIKDIRTKTGVADLPVILEEIKPTSSWKYAAQIIAADEACKQKLKNVDTMNTKNLALSSDNVHYNAASQIKIGTISAQRWLDMHYKYGSLPVPIANHSQPSSKNLRPSAFSMAQVKLFDLSGRELGTLKGSPAFHHGVVIAKINQAGESHGYKKVLMEK
jgi:hypothetical protein